MPIREFRGENTIFVTAPNPPARNLGLDLLRLVAILLVIGNHLQPPPGGGGLLFAGWMRGGWVGVDLFFVLSGFLVAGLLFKDHRRHGRVSIGSFLIRRGLKIYPAFWVLLACSVAALWFKGRPVPLNYVLGELCFVQNYASHLWGHTWSLAIEEHFYFGLALLTWLLVRRPGPDPFSWLPGIFAVIAVACLGLRTWNAQRYPDYNYSWDLFPTHLRIDSLFFGALLAYLTHYHHLAERLRWFPSWGRVAAGLTLLVPAFIFARETDRWVTVTGFNLFYLGSGLLVLGAVHFKESSSRLLRILGGLGAASYSIYLWHLPVNAWLGARILRNHDASPLFYGCYLAVCVLGALLLGYVMAWAVELPILRLRDRFCPSRSEAAATPGIPAAGNGCSPAQNLTVTSRQ